MIRDRLVCGINHVGIQRKLLAEKSLDFDKAYALALSIEAAERDSKDLQNPPTPQLVQYQASGNPPKLVDLDDAYEVLKTLSNPEQEPIIMDLYLNDVPVQMELDTGALVSVLNQATYDRISKNGAWPPLSTPSSQTQVLHWGSQFSAGNYNPQSKVQSKGM